MLTMRLHDSTTGGGLTHTCISLLLVLLGSLANSPVLAQQGQFLRSPCPNVFSYRLDEATNQVFGYVELHDLQPSQMVKLNVDLSIAVAVPQDNVGSITLIKSKEQSIAGIARNEPVQYRVNFPFNNVIPSVLAISVNGQTICTGRRVTGQIVTTINLEHSLFPHTHLVTNNGNPINTIPYYPVQQRPTRPPQPIATERPIVVQPERPVVAPTPSQASTCGQPAAVYNRLSINGVRTPKGQFPWAVPIFDTGVPSKPIYICGSTIITQRHLVTAAHCMYHPNDGSQRSENDLTTVPGMYNIDNFFEQDLQERGIAKIFIHDDYFYEEGGVTDSDLAVLKMDQAITYTDLIRPICLWSESDNLEQIVNIKGFVSGWGITQNGSSSYPSYVTATVVDRRDCARKLDRFISATARLFCADGHGSVPCRGDSGSGLVIKRGTTYFLRGIVSIGQYDLVTLQCDTTKYVVYTDVAPYRYWLSKTIKT